jgi:UDP-glucose 4-epimerase
VREVIHSVEKITGRKVPTIEAPRRAGDPPALFADSSKAQRELGWKVKFPDVDSIVGTAWKWHQSHPRGFASK